MVFVVVVDFGRKFGVCVRLDADVGRLFLVTSSGLFSSFGHGGRQMLGSNTQRLLDPKHRKKCEGINHSMDGNKFTRFLPCGIPMGGLFIGVVRVSGNNVQTATLTTPFAMSIQS
jgi:hypothetical protein